MHEANWDEFQRRFGGSSLRRVWLLGRLRKPFELAVTTGKLRRVFIWGSLVTAKAAPNDIDILLIMEENFDVDRVPTPAQPIFDSARAKLLFKSDVFWGRSSIGPELLDLWLDTYQKQCIVNLRKILLEAGKVHSRQDYARMAEPILLEIQQREQEIVEYLTSDLEQPLAR